MTENQEVLVTILVRIVIFIFVVVLNIILETVIIIVIAGLDINLASSVINITSAVYLDKTIFFPPVIYGLDSTMCSGCGYGIHEEFILKVSLFQQGMLF